MIDFAFRLLQIILIFWILWAIFWMLSVMFGPDLCVAKDWSVNFQCIIEHVLG